MRLPSRFMCTSLRQFRHTSARDSSHNLLESRFPRGSGEFEDPGFSELLWGGAHGLVFDDQADQMALGVGVESVEGVFWRIGVEAADGAVHGGGNDTAETRGGVDQENADGNAGGLSGCPGGADSSSTCADDGDVVCALSSPARTDHSGYLRHSSRKCKRCRWRR